MRLKIKKSRPKEFSLESFLMLNIKKKKKKRGYRLIKMSAGLVGFFCFGFGSPP